MSIRKHKRTYDRLLRQRMQFARLAGEPWITVKARGIRDTALDRALHRYVWAIFTGKQARGAMAEAERRFFTGEPMPCGCNVWERRP